MTKIQLEDIRIERISHAHNLGLFQSHDHELVTFLIEDALKNQQIRISVTYLWYLKSGELLGYITLLNDRINLEGNLKDLFRGKGISYHALPALKIGRLCVDNGFLRIGVGSLMIAFAAGVANSIHNEYSGCRFLVLDAKRTLVNDPIHFYKKFGFEVLKDRRKGTTPMYLDLFNNELHF